MPNPTTAELKEQLDIGTAIKSLDTGNKDWAYTVRGATIAGLEFPGSRPADFPSDSDIVTRQSDMHSKADAGKTMTEILASY